MFKYIIHIYLPSNCITYNVQTMVFFNRQSQEVGIPLWVKKKLYKEAPCEQAKMVSNEKPFVFTMIFAKNHVFVHNYNATRQHGLLCVERHFVTVVTHYTDIA